MIVVTGGAGFIGSAIVWRLNQLGNDNILIVDELGILDGEIGALGPDTRPVAIIHAGTLKGDVADSDVGRADGSIRRERSAVRLRADFRDRDGLDSMAHAVDVQSDLVAD